MNLLLQIRTALLKNKIQMLAGADVVGRLIHLKQPHNVRVAGELLQNRDFTQHSFGQISVGKSILNFFNCELFARWDVNCRNHSAISSGAKLFE